MAEPRRKQPGKYASVKHPTIQAVLHELFCFPTQAEAEKQLEALRRSFITAKAQLKEAAQPTVHLWIRGYKVTEEESKLGMQGQFALLACKKAQDGFTLFATPIETPIHLHPERGQVKRGNPNWGHPVLRSARKGKTYPTLEAAQAELNLLHKHFPGVSIPNPGKLYIIVYCADRPARERMVKHTLAIEATPEGQYRIGIAENTPRPHRLPKKAAPAPAAEQQPVGAFTAKIALSRQKRRVKSTTSQNDQGNRTDD